jgi:hypothetical protein
MTKCLSLFAYFLLKYLSHNETRKSNILYIVSPLSPPHMLNLSMDATDIPEIINPYVKVIRISKGSLIE